MFILIWFIIILHMSTCTDLTDYRTKYTIQTVDLFSCKALILICYTYVLVVYEIFTQSLVGPNHL